MNDNLIERQSVPQTQPVQQEPIGVVVAIRWDDSGKPTRHAASLLESAKVNAGDMLYTSPQAQSTQPLSDEQISLIYRQLTDEARKKFGTVLSFARAIEQAHGITKGTT